MKTILANLKSAVFNRKTVDIAGGEFSGDELKEVIRVIEVHDELIEALESFLRCPSVGSDGPGSSTLRVMDFNIEAARKVIAKAEGGCDETAQSENP